MAPTKSTRAALSSNCGAAFARKGLQRRTQNNIQENVEIIQTRGKRKADHSPLGNERVKRSALGNLTNNVNALTIIQEDEIVKKQQQQQQLRKKESVPITIFQDVKNIGAPARPKVTTRATAARINTQNQNEQTTKMLADLKVTSSHNTNKVKINAAVAPSISLPTESTKAEITLSVASKPVRRISNEFNKSEDSLYMSALENISSCESMRLSDNFEAARRRSALMLEKIKTEAAIFSEKIKNELSNTKDALDDIEFNSLPEGVEDFDKLNWNDPCQVSHYAFEIFDYLKSRESHFIIDDYMPRQLNLSNWMRSLLVDWMVEVQETFELNHETLYLAVKIVDLYLCKVVIKKEKLQLLGAAALFIACKFDERTPPLIEDFLYICDGAYKHKELVLMEIETLRTIDYDLGIPLSYRFLRRYARCAKVPMRTLTLARYILELSLMDYAVISLSDSQMAAAALFMALRLHGECNAWTATLEYFSGYKLVDFANIVPLLNACMHRKLKSSTIKTIRSKYTHKIFHEVAKVTLMTTDELFAEHSGTQTRCSNNNTMPKAIETI